MAGTCNGASKYFGIPTNRGTGFQSHGPAGDQRICSHIAIYFDIPSGCNKFPANSIVRNNPAPGNNYIPLHRGIESYCAPGCYKAIDRSIYGDYASGCKNVVCYRGINQNMVTRKRFKGGNSCRDEQEEQNKYGKTYGWWDLEIFHINEVEWHAEIKIIWCVDRDRDGFLVSVQNLSLIHISEPTDGLLSRMPSSA